MDEAGTAVVSQPPHRGEAVELFLPWPPSVNRYWRHNRGVTHISKEGRQYQRSVRDAAEHLPGLPITEDRLSLTIVAHPPDRRRRDIDNILKALLDGLQKGGVIRDDYQIKHLEVVMSPVIRGGGCSVRLEPIREYQDE